MKTRILIKTVTYGEGGWCAEIYTDDDGGSGYGDNAKTGRWYGSKEACEAVDPASVELYPFKVDNSPDPFDLMCERKHD